MRTGLNFRDGFSLSVYGELVIRLVVFLFRLLSPLFGASAYKNKIKTAQAEAMVQQKQYEYDKQVFGTKQIQMRQEVEKKNSLLSFYETSGLARGRRNHQGCIIGLSGWRNQFC
jgi:hypothetical protein